MATLINEEQLKNLKSLFNEGFSDFVLLYFSQFEKQEKELGQNISTKEMEKIQLIAHALKGNSLNMGATALAEKCSAIEQASISKNLDEVITQYKELETLYPTVKQTYLQIASSI